MEIMNREIKFRAWDLESQKLKYNYVANDYSSLTDVLELSASLPGWNDKIVLQVFTGLRDCNGTQIFEGDILKLDGESEYEHCLPKPKPGEYVGIFRVEHNLGHWGYDFDWVHVSGYECSTHIMGDRNESTGFMDQVEVIGNIYENPELVS